LSAGYIILSEAKNLYAQMLRAVYPRVKRRAQHDRPEPFYKALCSIFKSHTMKPDDISRLLELLDNLNYYYNNSDTPEAQVVGRCLVLSFWVFELILRVSFPLSSAYNFNGPTLKPLSSSIFS
jgi:hypothetical protein